MTEKRITLLVNMQQKDLNEDNLRLEIDDNGSLILYPRNDEDNFIVATVENVETLERLPEGYTWECCPFCETEVVIPSNKASFCPSCGKKIFPCSTCQTNEGCDHCHFEKINK